MIDILRDVAEFAAQAIPGVDGAGVALIDIRQGIHSVQTWAATEVLVHDIDAVQYDELKEGPCISCMESGRPTVSGSLGSDGRWPHFGGRVARMRVHSALALPLIVGDQVIGSINAYAKSRDAFGDHAVRLGSQFANTAAVAVYNAQLLANAHDRTLRLQRALDSRSVIDQAVGIIRSRWVEPRTKLSTGSPRSAKPRTSRCTPSLSGWSTRPCGAPARGVPEPVLSPVAYSGGDARSSAKSATSSSREYRSIINLRASSVRCSPLTRA